MKIDQKIIENSYSFENYIRLLSDLLSDNKTTGTDYSEQYVDFTKLNLSRMKRIVKQTIVNENLKAEILKIDTPQTWLSITEGWCGDAGQIIGAIETFSKLNPNIKHVLILRDENLNIIDQYLTNETRSIPKILILDGENNVITHWGPRPQLLQDKVLQWKKEPDFNKTTLNDKLHHWYTDNKTIAIQDSFLETLKNLDLAIKK